MPSRDCREAAIADSLLLGWESKPRKEIGFSARTPVGGSRRRLLRYSGDSHLISFGPTGTGKGRSVIVPNLSNYRGTTVAIDLKNGELTRITARRRLEFGDVFVIDPFEVTGWPRSGINPFDIFRWPGSRIEADAEMMADIFSQGNRGFKEAFWDQHAGGLLAALIACTATLPPAERTLARLIELVMSDDVVYNLAVLLDTKGKTLPPMAYREIASFLQMPDVTRGGVLATVLSYLKTFHSESALKTLEKSSLDLCDFINGRPMTIYLVLPVDRLHSHRAILKLFVGVLLKAIVTRTNSPLTRTLLLIDECGQLGTFPFLETFITLCRSFGCWVWTFWQDLAQLQTCYPTAWKTILNNSGVVQAFGFQNRDLAAQWSGYFDCSADALRRISSDEQLLLLPGEGEFRSPKLDYLRDEIFAGRYDENPLYHLGPEIHCRVDENEVDQSQQTSPSTNRKKRSPTQRNDSGNGGLGMG
jgi:type IV secretion system protein VirD4